MSRAPAETLGPYRILSRLGSGGMGEVLLAYDPRLERRVAIKRVRHQGGDDELRRARFQREARLAAGLAHPSIVQVFDLLTEGDEQLIVMEHVAGPTLRQLLDDEGPLPIAEGLKVGIAVARGLAHAHRHGVVHRDLKSENILLDEDAGAKITDFGIARLLLDEMYDESLTRDGAVPGTYRAMSPEQARGDLVDERSDLFSLGVLLYEMLTGRSPFLGSSDATTLAKVLEHQPRLASELVTLPQALDELIDRLLQKDPARRPSSAGLVAEQMEVIARIGQDPITSELPPSSSTKSIRTLVLTDLVHSTELISALGDRLSMELNELHDRHARALLSRHGGREIDKSDGFLLLFGRPVEAVRFALAYHAELAELSARFGVDLKARVAIHLGEIFLRENPPEEVRHGAKPLEVEGLAKSTAARVMGLAGAGQTLLTRGAFDLAQRAYADAEIDQPLHWLSHGLYQLKGLDEPIELCEVGPLPLGPLLPTSGDGTAVGGWTPARQSAGTAFGRRLLAIGLLLLALGSGWVLWQANRNREPLWVAVLPPRPATSLSAEDAERQSFVIRGALHRAVAGIEGLSLTNPTEIDRLEGSAEVIARAAAADEVLTSAFTCGQNTCRVELTRLRVVDGSTLWTEQLEVPSDRPLAATRALFALLRRAYPGHPATNSNNRLQVSPQDYAAYLELERQLSMGQREPRLEDLDRLEQIRRSSPNFLDVYLLEADLARQLSWKTHDEILGQRAFEVLDQADRLASDDLDLLRIRARAELTAGRIEAAEATLEKLEARGPQQQETLGIRATLLERKGRAKEALELFEQALDRRPSAGLHYNMAIFALRQGLTEVARQQIESYLRLVPESRLGRSQLARLELMHNPERAAQLFRQLLAEQPRAADYGNLGYALLLTGHLEQATAAFDEASALVPGNPYLLLNQADARKLAGQDRAAEEIYRRILDQLDSPQADQEVQRLTALAQVLAQLGESSRAVETLQQALRLEPQSQQVAFEASLVYSLVGDRTAAMVNARRALEQGYPPRAFDLPWFEDLRQHPELESLLSTTE